MKKYLLGLSAILLAVGSSSFTYIKANATKKFATSYWSYPTTDPQTRVGYGTETNWVTSTMTAFAACSNAEKRECVIAVDGITTIGGQAVPNLAGLTFDSKNFPDGGDFFIDNATQN